MSGPTAHASSRHVALGSPGRVLRRLLAFAVAAVLAPALVGLAAALVVVATGPNPQGGLGFVLMVTPLAALFAAPGAALFAAPWFLAAGVFWRWAPGRTASTFAGAGAGLVYIVVAGLLTSPTQPLIDTSGPTQLAILFLGLWPAVGSFDQLRRPGLPDAVSIVLLAGPPLAGAAAGWVYAWIAGKG